jgi:uncharacterized membrane protein
LPFCPGLPKTHCASLQYGVRFLIFFTSATYDLINLALLKDWPLKVVIVDIVWGVVLCSVVASLIFGAAGWIHRRGESA